MGLWPFSEPFFRGGTTTSLVPEPFHVAIAGHTYITEPEKCHRQFLNQLRPVTAPGDDVSEATLNPENLWRRGSSSWHLGSGQLWRDSSKDADPHRFRASKGVDIWTPFQLTQLRSASTQKKAAAGTNLRLISDPANGKLWLIDGVTVYVTTNPSAASPTWTACTGLPGTNITGATFTGAHIYVVAGTAVYRVTAAGSTVFASWYSATAVTGLEYANGRLIAWNAADGSLFELSAAAARTVIFTHPQGASFTWDRVIGAPNAIYAAGHLSYNAEIYRTDVTDATGALSVPKLSATITNEIVSAMAVESGYVILATKQSDGIGRIRLCQIVNPLYATGGALLIGPSMFAQLSQRPALSIDALRSVGRYIYFSWANLDATCTGVGCLDMMNFTQPLVPAYATDQMAGTAAAPVQGAVSDIVYDATSDQLWLAVSGTGLYGTTGATTLMADNYLDTGRIRYNLLDLKVFATLDLRCVPVAATGVSLTLTRDDGYVAPALNYTGGGTGPSSPLTLDHSSGEWADLRIVLTASVGGLSPKLSWWLLQSIPVPKALEEIIVAIILRDAVVSNPSEAAVTVPFDVEAELDYLRSLVASRSIVSFQSGGRIEDVYVNNMEQVPDRLSLGNRHYEGLVLAQLKTIS